jgi:hypothetical protein
MLTRPLDVLLVVLVRLEAHALEADGSGCRVVHRTQMQAVRDETPVEQRGWWPVWQRRGGQRAGRMPHRGHERSLRPNNYM